MAAAPDLSSNFSDSPSFSKCVKCLNDAIKPVVTSCFHTICRECYAVVVKENERCVFKCPVRGCRGCNSNGAGNSPPPPNAFVDLFREIFANISGPAAVRNCSICEKKGSQVTATRVCLDCPCERFLCKTCSENHASFSALSSHSLVPVEDYVEGTGIRKQREEMCAVHPSKNVDVVCSACGVRMCMVCHATKMCPKAVPPLTAHTIVDKEEMNTALKRDIEKACEECTVNVKEVDRLMEAAQDEVLIATADAEMALEKLDNHRAAVREEWEKTERHMDEMRSHLKASHQTRIDECKGMMKKLADVRQMNERGKVLGERSVSRAPKEDLGGLLAEVQHYQMSAPTAAVPPSSVLVFTGPDLAEIQKKMESVGGSLDCPSLYPPAINHRVLRVTHTPYECHHVGRSLIEAYHTNGQLCEIDDEGVRNVLHTGTSFKGTCSYSDGAQLLAVSFNSNLFYTFSRDTSGIFQLITNRVIPGSVNIWGASVSSSGLTAVTDYMKSCVHVLNTNGQTVKTVGPSVGVQVLGKPYHSVWSPDEKRLYVTNYGHRSVPKSVVCINIATDSVLWTSTSLDHPYNIYLVGGELYVTQRSGSCVAVLDPEDGSVLRLITCPENAFGRCVYADGPGKITIVSYKNQYNP